MNITGNFYRAIAVQVRVSHVGGTLGGLQLQGGTVRQHYSTFITMYDMDMTTTDVTMKCQGGCSALRLTVPIYTDILDDHGITIQANVATE